MHWKITNGKRRDGTYRKILRGKQDKKGERLNEMSNAGAKAT